MTKSAYESLGASASKAGLHQALKDAGAEEQPGLFAKVSSDLSGSDDYHTVVHCDGAGTKTIVAYLNYLETGDVQSFAGLADDALVMNLDDIFCVGAPEKMILANAIARNSRLISDDAISAIIKRYLDSAKNLAAQGIEIEISGGETADCPDIVRTLLVDAVITGRIKKSNLINTQNIEQGDVIIGLSSTGQTTYESAPNSGIASNGLTLARHALLHSVYPTKYPEVVDPSIAKELTYRGPFKVSDKPNGLGMSIGEALLSPTRTYAPVLKAIYQALGDNIHGVIHLTGGALTKVLRFGSGNLYVKNNLFPVPPIFKLIQEHGKVSWREMYQVFNSGQRIEIYLPKEHMVAVLKIAANFNLDAKQIGYVEKASTAANSVRVESEHGTFEYTI
jgi:phosphoribosylformylglycinamidine cyclo-ligase